MDKYKKINGISAASQGLFSPFVYQLILVFLFSYAYIKFMTEGVPFFWCDFDLLKQSLGLDIVSTGLFHPGPIPAALTKFIYSLNGIDTGAFRLLKGIIFSSSVVLIVLCVRNLCRAALPGILAGVLFASSPHVLKSAMWISDFELLTQALLLVSFLSYLYFARKQSIPRTIFFLVSVLLAIQTTNGWKVFSIALFIDLFLKRGIPVSKKLPLYLTLLLAWIIGTRYPENTSNYGLNLANLKVQWQYLMSMDRHLVLFCLIASGLFIMQIKDKGWRAYFLWFMTGFVFQLFYSRTDFQFDYEVTLFVPMVIMLSSGAYLFLKGKNFKLRIIGTTAGCLIGGIYILSNCLFSNHYRGAWGSLFIAGAKTIEYMEKNHKDCLVVYQSYTPDLLSFSANNRYFNAMKAANAVDLKKIIIEETSRNAYKEVYLVYHDPDVSNAIYELDSKEKVAHIVGANGCLYERLKDKLHKIMRSKDTPNTFVLYKYNGVI